MTSAVLRAGAGYRLQCVNQLVEPQEPAGLRKLLRDVLLVRVPVAERTSRFLEVPRS